MRIVPDEATRLFIKLDTASPATESPREKQGGLTSAKVRAGLRRIESQMRSCVLQDERPPSRISVRVRVDGQGRASFLSSSPRTSAKVGGCLRWAIGGLRFKATGGEPLNVDHSIAVGKLKVNPLRNQ